MEQAEQAQMEVLKKQIMGRLLTKDAYERLSRVRLANESLAAQLELYLMQLVQSGQLKGQIDDTKLKEILNMLTSKQETKIMRR